MARVLTAAAILLIAMPLSAELPDLLWSRSFGGADADVISAVKAGPNDYIVATGNFQGSSSFGGLPLVSAGEYDIFLSYYSPNGHHLWSRQFGDQNNDKVRDLAVDNLGNIIIVGDFFQTIDFGGGPLVSAGDKDAFVAKFDSDGDHLWSARFGDADYQSAECVGVDELNRIFTAGQFRGSLNLGGGSMNSLDQQDIFLAKFNTDGLHLWSRALPGIDNQWARDMHIETSGLLCLAGSFEGTLDTGIDLHSSLGDRDAYLVLYSALDGIPIWSRAFGDLENQDARAVSGYEPHGLVLAGDFEYRIDLGDGPMDSAGETDLFMAKLDLDGMTQWGRRFGDSEPQSAEDVVIDPYAGIGLTGCVEGAVDFGGGVLPAAGGTDIFMATFNSSGAHLGSAIYGDSSDQQGVSLSLDSSQHFLLGSWFFGNVNFGLGTHSSAGNADLVIARFDSHPTSVTPDARRPTLSAHPNPFNPSTEIRFRLKEPSEVDLDIYDLGGRRLRSLLRIKLLEAGEQQIRWDGRGDRGEMLPSGVYLCQLSAGAQLESRKLVLLK